MNRKQRNFRKMARRMGGCDFCISSGENKSVFPYYGLAPHKSFHHIKGHLIIGSIFTEEKRDNFEPNPEDSRMGTYLYCPKCGCGKKR